MRRDLSELIKEARNAARALGDCQPGEGGKL